MGAWAEAVYVAASTFERYSFGLLMAILQPAKRPTPHPQQNDDPSDHASLVTTQRASPTCRFSRREIPPSRELLTGNLKLHLALAEKLHHPHRTRQRHTLLQNFLVLHIVGSTAPRLNCQSIPVARQCIFAFIGRSVDGPIVWRSLRSKMCNVA